MKSVALEKSFVCFTLRLQQKGRNAPREDVYYWATIRVGGGFFLTFCVATGQIGHRTPPSLKKVRALLRGLALFQVKWFP